MVTWRASGDLVPGPAVATVQLRILRREILVYLPVRHFAETVHVGFVARPSRKPGPHLGTCIRLTLSPLSL
jgi:hypothetical protein